MSQWTENDAHVAMDQHTPLLFRVLISVKTNVISTFSVMESLRSDLDCLDWSNEVPYVGRSPVDPETEYSWECEIIEILGKWPVTWRKPQGTLNRILNESEPTHTCKFETFERLGGRVKSQRIASQFSAATVENVPQVGRCRTTL